MYPCAHGPGRLQVPDCLIGLSSPGHQVPRVTLAPHNFARPRPATSPLWPIALPVDEERNTFFTWQESVSTRSQPRDSGNRVGAGKLHDVTACDLIYRGRFPSPISTRPRLIALPNFSFILLFLSLDGNKPAPVHYTAIITVLSFTQHGTDRRESQGRCCPRHAQRRHAQDPDQRCHCLLGIAPPDIQCPT